MLLLTPAIMTQNALIGANVGFYWPRDMFYPYLTALPRFARENDDHEKGTQGRGSKNE